MGFFGPDETHGERAARAAQERDRAMHDLRGQEWERRAAYDADRDWVQRNRIHKQSVFETEREMARREGRAPLYYSPEEVPDLQVQQDPDLGLGWSKRDIAIRLGIFAYKKVKEKRAANEAARQAYYAQNPTPDGTTPPVAGQGPTGYAPGPYHGIPQAPHVVPMTAEKSPVLALVLIWLTVLLGVPVVTGVLGLVVYLVSMGSSSGAVAVSVLSAIVNLAAWAAGILATVHIALRHTAHRDLAKLEAAEKWHPLYWPRRFFSGRRG